MMRRPFTASEGSLAHGDRDLRHEPDRTAKEITMAFVSIRIITVDVARLAGCSEKPPEFTKDRKKEAMNITDTMAGRDLEALRAAIAGQVFVPGQAG